MPHSLTTSIIFFTELELTKNVFVVKRYTVRKAEKDVHNTQIYTKAVRKGDGCFAPHIMTIRLFLITFLFKFNPFTTLLNTVGINIDLYMIKLAIH